MKNIFLILIAGFTLLSCSESKEKKVVRTEHIVSEDNQTAKVVSNRELSMEIDGMSCVMGCGSSIRKELYATKGVSEVSFDFEENRKTNIATIKFDEDLVTVDQMIDIVNTMNEKQFKVGETKSNELETEPTVLIEETTESKKPQKSVIKSSSVEFPSFMELLSNFFTKNISKITKTIV